MSEDRSAAKGLERADGISSENDFTQGNIITKMIKVTSKNS